VQVDDQALSLQHGLAIGTAAAPYRAHAIGRVVVRQLLAAADVAGGANPDGVPDDLCVAVRGAGVIDIAGDVAAHGRITHIQVIQLETPDVTSLQVSPLTLQALLVRDLLTGVMNDSRVLGDRQGGKDSPPLDAGPALLKH